MGRTCIGSLVIVLVGASVACGGRSASPRVTSAPLASSTAPSEETVRKLVGSLDLDRYKGAIRGLTQFGDRRQGTERNRRAIDWIAAQLASYGCRNVERLAYDYGGPREEVYCTKVGTSHPDEMYIVSAHMDGRGDGEAANDDGSGSAIVLELARILNAPGVKTQRSVRFIFWNNEETGLNGSQAYVAQRAALQGRESPPGSGRYPEPRWLGVIQHDMMLFDHGKPRVDGVPGPEQRAEADVNIEFQASSKLADASQKLAWVLAGANEKYASDYPAAVGNHMSHTDSTPFMNLAPSISVRENERLKQIGHGWDPHWHKATDVFATFSDADFRLGLNAAQTTLGAIAELAGASVD